MHCLHLTQTDLQNTVQTRYEWVDSLKGIAIAGVVLVHAGGSILPSPLQSIVTSGARGVQLFFIISAFLTFQSLQKLRTSSLTRSWKSDVKWFISRILRIAPLYYCIMLLSLYLYGFGPNYWLGEYSHISSLNVFSHLVFLNGLNPYWINSIIGIEWYVADLVLFMLVSLVLYRWIKSFERALLFVTVGFCLSCVFTLFMKNWAHDYVQEAYIQIFSVLAQFPAWGLGVLLYFLLSQGSLQKYNENKTISYCLLVAALFVFSLFIYEVIIITNGTASQLILGVCLLTLIISQVLHSCPIIVNKIWGEMGKRSFGIYLTHLFMFSLYDRYLPLSTNHVLIDWGIRYISVLGLSFLASWLTKIFIEEPAVRLGKKIFHV